MRLTCTNCNHYSYRHKRWQLLSTRNNSGIYKASLIKLKLFFFPAEAKKDEIAFWATMGYVSFIWCISLLLTVENGISSENKFLLLANKINNLIPIMETNFKAVTTDLSSTSLVMALGWLFALPTLLWLVMNRYFIMEKIFLEIKVDSPPKTKLNFIKIVLICVSAYILYNYGIKLTSGYMGTPVIESLYGQGLISWLASIAIVGGGYWILLFGYVLLFVRRATSLSIKTYG